MLSVAVSALAFQAPLIAPQRSAVSRTSVVTATTFDDGMANFKSDFPWMAKNGFGPTVKAERWNGRHAMFGWLAIIATGYAKGHGWFPDAAVQLKYEEWGALVQMGFGQNIPNERAIIMIAHIHALGVSMAAAFGPQVLGDSLTLLEGEVDEEPYGLFPPLKGQTGLTPAAEMYNGRMAMMGLIAVITASTASGKDILEVVDIGLGGLLMGSKLG